jgi:hypothetical protein
MNARKIATPFLTGGGALTLAACGEYGYRPNYGWGSGHYGNYGGSGY